MEEVAGDQQAVRGVGVAGVVPRVVVANIIWVVVNAFCRGGGGQPAGEAVVVEKQRAGVR